MTSVEAPRVEAKRAETRPEAAKRLSAVAREHYPISSVVDDIALYVGDKPDVKPDEPGEIEKPKRERWELKIDKKGIVEIQDIMPKDGFNAGGHKHHFTIDPNKTGDTSLIYTNETRPKPKPQQTAEEDIKDTEKALKMFLPEGFNF